MGNENNKIILPRLLRDGAVLQRDKRVHIWGWGSADSSVEVKLAGVSKRTDTNASGRFDVFFDPFPAGGAYSLTVEGDGSIATSKDIYFGDVFLMSGQSNMEFPMCRVKDTYPEEWDGKVYDKLRSFKISEKTCFDKPLEELETGEWKKIGPDMLDDCPALGYFLCKELYEKTGVPIGVINATLGGSPIEAWMSRDMLADYPEYLEIADRYNSREYIEWVLKNNDKVYSKWDASIRDNDIGIKKGADWYNGSFIDGGEDIFLPTYFRGTALDGFTGSVWLGRKFEASEEMAEAECMLWLGTLIDSDVVYINGTFVGTTPYCYPPRRYPIPAGILKEGTNTICIQLMVNGGAGGVTPHKSLTIFRGDVRREIVNDEERIVGATESIDLAGSWKYAIGAHTEKIGEVDFIGYKPTGLFNGMLYPCTNYPIFAFLWYQGESNTEEPEGKYFDLSRLHIESLRKLWGEELPYIYTRLPELDAMPQLTEEEKANIKIKSGWEKMRELQTLMEQQIHNSYMADSDGTGELHDIHPQGKKPIAKEYARIIYSLLSK